MKRNFLSSPHIAVIVQYEAKRTLPELADAEDVYEALERLPDEEYEEMCDMMLDTPSYP